MAFFFLLLERATDFVLLFFSLEYDATLFFLKLVEAKLCFFLLLIECDTALALVGLKNGLQKWCRLEKRTL